MCTITLRCDKKTYLSQAKLAHHVCSAREEHVCFLYGCCCRHEGISPALPSPGRTPAAVSTAAAGAVIGRGSGAAWLRLQQRIALQGAQTEPSQQQQQQEQQSAVLSSPRTAHPPAAAAVLAAMAGGSAAGGGDDDSSLRAAPTDSMNAPPQGLGQAPSLLVQPTLPMYPGPS